MGGCAACKLAALRAYPLNSVPSSNMQGRKVSIRLQNSCRLPARRAQSAVHDTGRKKRSAILRCAPQRATRAHAMPCPMCFCVSITSSSLYYMHFVQVYHPNIDLEGKICLNILREDWKPVLSISSVIFGLQFLFLVRMTWLARSCMHACMHASQRTCMGAVAW